MLLTNLPLLHVWVISFSSPFNNRREWLGKQACLHRGFTHPLASRSTPGTVRSCRARTLKVCVQMSTTLICPWKGMQFSCGCSWLWSVWVCRALTCPVFLPGEAFPDDLVDPSPQLLMLLTRQVGMAGHRADQGQPWKANRERKFLLV